MGCDLTPPRPGLTAATDRCRRVSRLDRGKQPVAALDPDRTRRQGLFASSHKEFAMTDLSDKALSTVQGWNAGTTARGRGNPARLDRLGSELHRASDAELLAHSRSTGANRGGPDRQLTTKLPRPSRASAVTVRYSPRAIGDLSGIVDCSGTPVARKAQVSRDWNSPNDRASGTPFHGCRTHCRTAPRRPRHADRAVPLIS